MPEAVECFGGRREKLRFEMTDIVAPRVMEWRIVRLHGTETSSRLVDSVAALRSTSFHYRSSSPLRRGPRGRDEPQRREQPVARCFTLERLKLLGCPALLLDFA